MTTVANVDTFVTVGSTRKSVYFNWRFFDYSARKLHAERRVTIETNYWPTIATGYDGYVYVGGIRRNGKSVIEKWVFSDPILGHPTEPDGNGFIVPGQRVSISTVYNHQESGRYIPLQIIETKYASTPTLLVRWLDSRDLYYVDMASGSATLAITSSSQPPTGTLSQPSLAADNLSRLWRRTHHQFGSVYVLGPDGVVYPDDICLVFIDGDKDGLIDSTSVYDNTSWPSSGFANDSDW